MRNIVISILAILSLFAFFSCDQTATKTTPTGTAAAPASKTGDNVMAKVGDYEILESEVNAKVRDQLIKFEQEIYNIKKKAVNELVSDHILNNEAKARGVSKSDLLKEEVDSKLTAVSDAAIKDFYEKNKARIKKPLEEIKDAISSHLQRKVKDDRKNEFINELRQKAEVKVYLEPMRIEISGDDDPSMGPKDAPIQIIEFSDFECPYCKRGADAVQKVTEHYGDKVHLVFRDFPLSFHKKAKLAAEASQCANDQGKFWEYHNKLFVSQRKLNKEDLLGYARDFGLDLKAFESCLDTGKYSQEVQKDMNDGSAAGVKGTPCFFINGIYLSGAQPFESFREIIDEELNRKGIPLPKG
jgi:protein-disulfide isomerase